MKTNKVSWWGVMLCLLLGMYALSAGCPAPPPDEQPTEVTQAEPKAEPPTKDASVEPGPEPRPEPKPEPGPEPKAEPGPEPPGPEPRPEPQPEPPVADAGPELVPEKQPEATPEAAPEPPAPPKDETLTVVLSGNQEVPSVNTVANGTATVKVNAARDEISVDLTVNGITGSDIKGAHIHYGKPGQNGPVLFVIAAGALTSPVSKTFKAADLQAAASVGINTFADAAKAILEGRCYINVHSAKVASGEIRGQVGTVKLSVVLNGHQEVPRVDTAAAGTGTVTINNAQDEITVDLTHTGLTSIQGVHIHFGLPGENGPVFFSLASGSINSPFQIKLKTAQLQKLTAQGINSFADAVDALISGRAYINMHTTKVPGGEIRGHVGQAQLRVVLTGNQEVPPLTTTATGDAWVFINGDHSNVHVTINTKDAKEITAAHIHYGLPGENGAVMFGIASSSFGSPFDVDLDVSKLVKIAAKNVNTMSDAARALLSGRGYINVHTRVNALGEIRGQVGPSVLSVILSGKQEVPPVDSKTTGNGYVAINGNHTRLEASAALANLVSGTAAHIHLATPGQNGGVLFGLKSATFVSPINVTLTEQELTKQQGVQDFAQAIDALLSGQTYFNIHTQANPLGEVRGQVGPAMLQVDLSANQEVPPFDSKGTGTATVYVNGEHSGLNVELDIKNVKDITAAHIHLGQAGENGPVLFGLASAAFTNKLTKALLPSDLNAVANQGINDMSDAVDALITGRTYINIHSMGAPLGEVRGQVGYIALKVNTSGKQEVPPVTSTASSTGWVTINGAHTTVSVNLDSSGVTNFAAAHIHLAPAGNNGPVLFALATGALPASYSAALTDQDLVKQANAGINSFADAIHALSAGHTYINIHTQANPLGELRGQVGPVYMKVQLTGTQEVPANDSASTADGAVSLNADHTALQTDLTYKGLQNIVAAHIHLGLAGTNGPVLFTLANATFASPLSKALAEADLSKVSSQGIDTFADAVNALIAGQTYVNIHTQANAAGEVRGQVGQVQLRAVLSGRQEIPANTSSAFGTALVSVDTYHKNVHLNTDVNGFGSNITAAHIHIGMPGRNGPVVFSFPNGVANKLSGAALESTNFVQVASLGINTFDDAVEAMISGKAYINIHTQNTPAGETRGQLGRVSLRSAMGPEQETHNVTSTATGIGTVHIDSLHASITVQINHTNLTNITGAHIHAGAVGQNGGVIFALTTSDVTQKNEVFLSPSDFSKLNSPPINNYDEGLDTIISGLTYLNVHTSNTGGAAGEIRGQVGAARMAATLQGSQEVPPVTTTATGNATLALDGWQTGIELTITHTISNTITGSHIHLGDKGQVGPVLYGITTGALNSGLVKELVETDLNKAASQNIQDMLRGIHFVLSGGTYINIHTNSFAGGELRGQLEGP